MAKRFTNWKYEIGYNIKDDNRDITITDRMLSEYLYKNNGKEYKYYYQQYSYKCNICGFDKGLILSSNLQKGTGCSCCGGRTVVKGINDIGTLRPDLLKYFVDINEAYIYTIRSAKKVKCKCPICNSEKYISINNLSQHGFSCNYCSDGISYPEKFIGSLLKQLKIKHICQYVIDGYKYKYDFYLEENNAIIEVNGEQHYNNTFFNKKIEDIYCNDIQKRKIAMDKGFTYIELDCRLSELNYIKKSVINNDFFVRNFDLSVIDWDLCDKNALKNILIEVCKYWEHNKNSMFVSDVAKHFNIGYTTALKYIHIGNDIGLCLYDKQTEIKKTGKKRSGINNPMYGTKLSKERKQDLLQYSIENGKKKAKQVCQYSLDDKLIAIHESINSIKKKFGYVTYSITECCNGNRKTAYKFKWRWLNKMEIAKV